MKIKKYLNKYYKNILINNNHEVSLITDNSNYVIENSIFVAIKGYNYNGISFVEEVINKGAKTIIYQNNDLKCFDFMRYPKINFIMVNNTKIELARLLNFFNFKKIKAKIIGITGTNGKTTISTNVYNCLKLLNKSVLLLGTEGNFIFYNNKENFIKTVNTTPSITDIYHLMIKYLFDYIVMEVSSQGIEELRVLGIKYDIIAFSNITQDHLDYHKTIDNYVNSKSKLVYSLKEDGILILNKDMNYFDNISKLVINQIYTYSVTTLDSNCYGKICDNFIDSMEIEINYNGKKYDLITKLLGDFNLENLLSTATILLALEIKIDKVINLLEKLTPVKGRMNLFLLDWSYVIVDFAHTPDGVKQVLNYVNKVKKGRVITILGCGGNKDKVKRPIMGKIATLNSDIVIFTEDNSRNEKTIDIISEMISKVTTKNYYIECDRQKAIDLALSLKEVDDIILLLGKGNESFIIRDEKIAFSDIDYVINLGGVRLNE